MKTRTAVRPDNVSLAATLAPEEIRPGDEVAILNQTCELPSCLWLDSAFSAEALVRLTLMAGDGLPLRVLEVCLPFVLVKTVAGDYDTVDVRRTQLVRLGRDYARRVRQKLGKKPREPE